MTNEEIVARLEDDLLQIFPVFMRKKITEALEDARRDERLQVYFGVCEEPAPRAPVTIFINTEPKQVPHLPITFQQVVALAYPDKAESDMFKVNYRLGRGHSSLWALIEGGVTYAEEGMIFTVSCENRS